MSGKRKNSVVAIYAVIAVIFIVAFFVIPFERNATSWSAFAFGMISIIAGAIITFIAFDKGEGLKSKIYGFPMFRLGYYYTTVQLIISIIFIALELFVDVPSWIVIVSGLLLLGISVIGVIAVDNVRDVIEQHDARDAARTRTVETFRVDVDSLVGRCADNDVRKAMEKLAEEFKYSDPVSSEATAEIEAEISAMVSELNGILNGDKKNCLAKISEISVLLDRRNKECKKYK